MMTLPMGGPGSPADRADAIAETATGPRALAAALERSADGVVLLAPHASGSLSITFANAAFCRLLGREPHEVIGVLPATFRPG